MKGKFFTLLTLLLCAVTSSWALSGVEKAKNTGTKDTPITGTSYTIAGTYIAGAGGSMAGDMANKGVKLRTGSDGARVVFTVNSGYTITDFVLHGISNYALKSGASEPCISVIKIEVDGVETEFTGGGEFPAKGSNTSGTVKLTGISATSSIAIYFDNNNASGTQINAYYEIMWFMPDSEYPTSTTVTPTEAMVNVGKTKQLTGAFTGGEFEGEWVSDAPGVATVDADGLVTGVAPGVANITYQWKDDQSDDKYKATAVITVKEFFDASKYAIVKKFDFTTWGATTLTVNGTTCGDIYNKANDKNNPVYPCTNDGLTDMAFQYGSGTSVFASNKGWKIDDTGLLEGSGAGRCAAIMNIKNGQYVEFNHTSGEAFYTKNDGSDSGIKKEEITLESNHHVYKAEADGMIGFEMTAGKYVNSIIVYTDVFETIAPAKEMVTFCSSNTLDFSYVDGLEAYVVSETSANSATLKKATIVPANLGVILVKTGSETSFKVPVTDSSDAITSLLLGTTTDTTLAADEAYVLSNGKFVKATAGTLPAGKAYLPVASVGAAPELTLVFADGMETTGIGAIETFKANDGVVYNLNGQRVAMPIKGLYIVGGRKVVVK